MFATPLPQTGAGNVHRGESDDRDPNGVQMFCWLATLWSRQKPRFELPLVWVVAFIVVFMIGGLTGVMLASVSIDIAGARYVLRRGASALCADRRRGVSRCLARFITGFQNGRAGCLTPRRAWWHFVLFFIGFNMTFWPMHHLGLRGMTRRRYTYLPETGWMTV